MDVSITGLRVLREISERGTFTAAAATLGYTQSAVSRQVAALEQEVGATLFDRTSRRLTAAGLTLLRHATVILAELDAADRELHEAPVRPAEVRLGVIFSAGVALLPQLMSALRRDRPDVRMTTREGTSPALARAVRAGTVDLALITSRPPHRTPDDQLPRLAVETLGEIELLVAASATGPFAGRFEVGAAELAEVDWVASPSKRGEPLLGVWPGLPGRSRVVHSTHDWLTKIGLVAAGSGITTVPSNLRSVLPDNVITLRVSGVPRERRRLSLIRAPGPLSEAQAVCIDAVRNVGLPS